MLVIVAFSFAEIPEPDVLFEDPSSSAAEEATDVAPQDSSQAVASTYIPNNVNAIGLRFGISHRGGLVEINYQRQKYQHNRRVEFGLQFFSKGMGITNDTLSSFNFPTMVFAYQWCWNITDEFNWYLGPSVRLGPATFTFALQVGTEYDLSASGTPLLLSLDWRPGFDLLNGYWNDIAVGVRYKYKIRYAGRNE
jgi:hypothetical protein